MRWEEIEKERANSNFQDGSEVYLVTPEARMSGMLISLSPQHVTVRVTQLRLDAPGTFPVVPDFGYSPVDMVLKIRLDKLESFGERD